MAEVTVEDGNMNSHMREFVDSIVVDEAEVGVPETPETPPAAPETPPAVPETPATPPETPPAPPEATSPPAPVVIPASPEASQENTLKAIFGDQVTTAEQAKALLEKLKNPEPAPSPFADAYVEGLNKYIKEGGTKNDYDKIVTLDVTKLDAFNALKTLTLLKNPELSAEDVELSMQARYSMGEDDEEVAKRIGKVDLVQDGNKAKETLLSMQDKYRIPEPARQQIDHQKIEQERISAWQPELNSIIDKTTEIEVALEGIPALKFSAISPETKAAVLQDIKNSVQYSGIALNQENRNEIARIARERIIVREFNGILKAVSEQTKTATEALIRAEYSNPAPVTPGDTPPPASNKSAMDIQFEKDYRRV